MSTAGQTFSWLLLVPTRAAIAPYQTSFVGPPEPNPPKPPAAVLSGVVRRVGLVDYLLNPATRLMVIAMITAPKTNEIRACRRTVVRMVPLPMSVSETWNVIPTVKAM